MHALAGKPAVIQVRRRGAAAGEPPVNLFVPPAFHALFGARMEMGEVAAVRNNSPAAASGVPPRNGAGGQASDVLATVWMTDDLGRLLFLAEAPREMLRALPILRMVNQPLDPVRLPAQLAEAAAGSPRKKLVTLGVLRLNPINHNKEPTFLGPVAWDDSRSGSDEAPVTLASPLSVPQLGLAYWVNSKVVEVEKGSPAAQAGLRADDIITEVRFKVAGKKPGEWEWGRWEELESQRGKEKRYDQWAQVFWA